jgi:hypothetical protein
MRARTRFHRKLARQSLVLSPLAKTSRGESFQIRLSSKIFGLTMNSCFVESFMMNVSNASTACPNSRKLTHLMPGNTDNAEGLVVILCCGEEWLRRIQNPKTIGAYGY